jgi:hypothetical protein
MPAPARALHTALHTAVLSAALVLGGLVAAAPSVAATPTDPEALSVTPDGDALVQPYATIEDEEAFCRWLTGIYVNHPTYYTVRVYNCRYTEVFVKGEYLNGTFATCVLVPARSSRHLGGSVVKPMEDAQVC